METTGGAGAVDAVVCEHHAYGGAGAAKLGEAVIAACREKVDFQFLYDLQQPIKVRHHRLCLPGSLPDFSKCCILQWCLSKYVFLVWNSLCLVCSCSRASCTN